MAGFRRQPHSHLGHPIGRAVARTSAYRPDVELVAVGRAQQRRLRVTHSRLGKPVGRAIARTSAYPVRVILQASERAGAPQRRYVHSRLRRPIGRALARPTPLPIRVVTQAARRASAPARRPTHEDLRPPVGRAVARTRPYPADVTDQAPKRAAQAQRRQLLHSRHWRAYGGAAAAQPARPQRIRAFLVAVARAAGLRRRLGRNRLGRPAGRALARTRPAPILVKLQAGRRAALRQRSYPHSLTTTPVGRTAARTRPPDVQVTLAKLARRRQHSRLGRPVRPLLAPRPAQDIRTQLVAVARSYSLRRQAPHARLRRPIGKAVSRATPYRIRAVLQRQRPWRLRFVARPDLRRAFGAPGQLGTLLRYQLESREPVTGLDAVEPRTAVDDIEPPSTTSTIVRGQ